MKKERLSPADCQWHNNEFLTRVNEVITMGQAILGETALVHTRPIGYEDVDAADLFLSRVIKEQSLLEHCRLAGSVAGELTDEVNARSGSRMNRYAHQAALQLHDLGRTVIHSFMETDEMTDILWKGIGLREDLKTLTHNAHLYWDEEELNFESLPLSTRISVISDVGGKRSVVDPTRIRHAEEFTEAVKQGKKKYLEKEILSAYEKELIRGKLVHYSQKEEYVILNCLQWAGELGININQILDKVWEQQV